MTNEELKRSKDELEEKIINNNNKNKINDERTRMAKVNQFEYQFGITACFSIFAYIILYFIIGVTHYTPANLIPAIILGGSIAAGTTGTILLNKLFEIKERLKAFTNAKKDKEILEEEIKYAIEMEKVNSRNNALALAIDTLKNNYEVYHSLSKRYNMKDKNAPIDIEDAKRKLDELQVLLEEKEKELDILSTKRVLHERTRRFREKGINVATSTMFTFLGGVLALGCGAMPFFLIKDVFTLGFPILISLFFGGMIGTGAYLIKRTEDVFKVFNHFNNELDEEKLPILVSDAYEEMQRINNSIQEKIVATSIVETQVQEQKRVLEAFTSDTEEKETSQNHEKELVIEEVQTLPTQSVPKKLTLNHDEKRFN